MTSIAGTSGEGPSVLPGRYRTVIKVYNHSGGRARIRPRIALSSVPGHTAALPDRGLEYRTALSINCFQIANHLPPGHGNDGFLTIESTRSLRVQATYTAGPQEVASILVHEVPELTGP